MKTDAKTFAAILDKYQEPLYWHIRRLVVSHEDAQDILQESLIKIYGKLWQLRDESALKPWMYRIATNEVNRFFKKNHVALQSEGISDELVEKLAEGGYVNFDELEGIKLQKAMMTLSPQQRTVFSLRYYDELDYEQISYITGSTVATLKVSYHNAKEKIKYYLENR